MISSQIKYKQSHSYHESMSLWHGWTTRQINKWTRHTSKSKIGSFVEPVRSKVISSSKTKEDNFSQNVIILVYQNLSTIQLRSFGFRISTHWILDAIFLALHLLTFWSFGFQIFEQFQRCQTRAYFSGYHVQMSSPIFLAKKRQSIRM